MIFWEVWKERNNRVFRNKANPVPGIMHAIRLKRLETHKREMHTMPFW